MGSTDKRVDLFDDLGLHLKIPKHLRNIDEENSRVRTRDPVTAVGLPVILLAVVAGHRGFRARLRGVVQFARLVLHIGDRLAGAIRGVMYRLPEAFLRFADDSLRALFDLAHGIVAGLNDVAGLARGVLTPVKALSKHLTPVLTMPWVEQVHERDARQDP